MKEEVFKWLDAHNLTRRQVEDFNYLENIINNYAEEFEELEEEDVISIILDYQLYFFKKL